MKKFLFYIFIAITLTGVFGLVSEAKAETVQPSAGGTCPDTHPYSVTISNGLNGFAQGCSDIDPNNSNSAPFSNTAYWTPGYKPALNLPPETWHLTPRT